MKVAEIRCKTCPKLATSPANFLVCKECDASIHSLSTRQGHEREEIAQVKAKVESWKMAEKQRKKKKEEDQNKARKIIKQSKVLSAAMASLETEEEL